MRRFYQGLAVAVTALAVAAGCTSPANALSDGQYKQVVASSDDMGKALHDVGALPVRFVGNDVMYVVDGDPNCLPKKGEKARADCPSDGIIDHPHIFRGVNQMPKKKGGTDIELSPTQLVISGATNGTWGNSVRCTWTTAPDGSFKLTASGILLAVTKAAEHEPAGKGFVITTDDGVYWLCDRTDVPSPQPRP